MSDYLSFERSSSSSHSSSASSELDVTRVGGVEDNLSITLNHTVHDELDVTNIVNQGYDESINVTHDLASHLNTLSIGGNGEDTAALFREEDTVGDQINHNIFGGMSPIAPSNRTSFDTRIMSLETETKSEPEHLEDCLNSMYPGRDEIEQFRMLQDIIAEVAPPDKENNHQLLHSIGEEIVDAIAKERTLKKNIHLLSVLAKHMRKKDAERLIQRSISNAQWQAANKHMSVYGAGMQSNHHQEHNKINHRRCIEEKTIQDFIEWLNANDFLQNLAFGEKVVTMSNGYHVAIESVKRTQSITKIIRDYYRHFLKELVEDQAEIDSDSEEVDDDLSTNNEDNEDNEEDKCNSRCSQVSPKSRLRCFLDKDHMGKHKYTPPDLLSPSTITKLLLELTSGEIKSRAGLDNIDVNKGHANFEHMSQMVDMLTSIIGSDEAKEKGEDLKFHINGTREFHKVDFARHLESGNSKCMCIRCGLRCKDTDNIGCESKGSHDPPCQDCQNAFQLLTDISKLHTEAEAVAKNRYTETPALEDDIDSWKQELETCFRNLVDYRAHLVHKHSEAAFDSDFYQDLADDEAVVVCDWKMKILSSKYRESQAEWFSKRGSSLLGFEIHLKSKKDDSRKVFYHLFLSDDTTQDSEAVICAKHYLYTVILPKYGVKKVRFRSDGAMCFSSKEAKAMMALWDNIAKINGGAYETSYKVSVSGCGKTALDVSC